ncbi:MAG TPA: hypothetical protein VFU87_01405, partial [Sphingomicrobium sp.]|nr:hypothetical protein [Sphingomicrobium sp.]
AITSTKGKLSDEDTKALLAFAQTPAFSKLRQVRPNIRELIHKTLTAPDPDYDRRAEVAIGKALEAHIASLGPEDQN